MAMFDLDVRSSRHQILDQTDDHGEFLEIVVTRSFVLRFVDTFDAEEEDGEVFRWKSIPMA